MTTMYLAKKFYVSDAKRIMERDEDGNEKTNMHSNVKPVLTRWEVVGNAAHVTHETYLPTFCALQVSIGTYGTKMYGLVAAEMISLTKEPEIYSDLTFNRYHISEEMEWNRKSQDLTKVGYRCHHLAVRYYVMHNRLMNFMKHGVNHVFFTD
jgi:hypothetical protein